MRVERVNEDKTYLLQALWRRLAVILGLLVALTTSAAAETFAAPRVTVADGRLSLVSNGASLGSILQAIAAQTGIVVRIDSTAGQRPIAGNFEELPFAAGLAQLLADVPGHIIVRDAAAGYAGVAKIFVLGSQDAPNAELPQPLPKQADVRAMIEAMPDARLPPGIRAAMEEALDAQTSGLSEAHEVGRAAALARLLERVQGGAGAEGSVAAALRARIEELERAEAAKP